MLGPDPRKVPDKVPDKEIKKMMPHFGILCSKRAIKAR